MVTAITHQVKISVVTSYEDHHSNSANDYFMFAYRITIENLSEYTIQLLRRKWLIFDSDGTSREVEGEGVVGQQPVLNPGEQHTYVSGCQLTTEIGTMKGEFQMQRLADHTLFNVEIPKFELIADYRLN
jgi:ApaG protein